MKILKKYRYQILLCVVACVLFVANFETGKYLAGWDSLSTELNPTLAIRRAFEASWQEYQSFGLPAGMAHAADLVRAIFIWLLTLVLPQSVVRYFFHILMLLVGGIGAFYLFRHVANESKNKTPKLQDFRTPKEGKDAITSPLGKIRASFQHDTLCHSGVNAVSDRISEFPIFLGTLFYMLNLGTIQIFFVPFEPFSIFFAALPWQIYYFLKYISQCHCEDPAMAGDAAISSGLLHYVLRQAQDFVRNDNPLLKLFLINLLFVSQAYVQTMFFVYILVLLAISLPFWRNWKKILIAFFTIFIVNSFWIFPQLYFLKGNSVGEAKINQLATEDVYYQNKEKGNVNDFLQFKGFYYDLKKTDTTDLFDVWKNHFENPYFKYLPYFLVIIFLLGLFKKDKYQKSFVFAFVVVSIALLNDTQPFAFLNDLLRQNSLINQIFRSPFTKFVIPYSLLASYFFVKGLFVILEAMKWLIESLYLTFTKIKDPIVRSALSRMTQSQIGVLEFFLSLQSQRDCRVANAPRNDMNRLTLLLTLFLLILYSLPAFTGNFFSPSMKITIPNDYLETINYFKKVDKNQRIALLPEYTFWGWYYTNWGYNGSGFLWYGIEQPIVSRTFDVWSKASEGYFWQLKSALESEDQNRINAVFKKYDIDYLILDKSLLPVSASLKAMQIDKLQEMLTNISSIEVAKESNHLVIYKINNLTNNFLYTTSSLPMIGPNNDLVNQDVAFIQNGDYVSQYNQNPDIYYPFSDLFSQTEIKTKKWDLKETDDAFLLKTTLNIDPAKYLLSTDSAQIKARLYDGYGEVEYANKYESLIYQNNLVIKIPKTLVKKFTPIDYKQEDCAKDNKTTCFGFDAPYIDQKYSYLLAVRNKNVSGRRLFFYALDKTKNQAYIEDRLRDNNQLYFLPNKSQYNLGYSFSFQNNSYDNLRSQNILSNMDLYLFPYEDLKNIHFVKPGYYPFIQENKFDVLSKKYTNYWYEIELKNNADKYLVFNQAYDAGWIAFSTKNLTHIKINNWANGFDISSLKNEKIVIIYLPQILEFIGLILLLVYYILIKYENNHRT